MASASRSQDWALDALGNWSTFTTDGTPQARTHNKQNQVTAVGGNTLTFDSNGNTTTDDAGRALTYDAWNRLVSVTAGADTASFTYDGLNRRLTETVNGTTTDLYYSAAWQVLEERVGGAATAQYVWSPVYVDALVLRDRDADSDGSLEERLYAQQDANYNVTALVDAAGNVVERYTYDPYGQSVVLDAAWAPLSQSAYGWQYRWQGLRLQEATDLYHARRREVSATLGRPVQRDPIEFGAGDPNLYRWEGNGPAGRLDPLGLDFFQTIPAQRYTGPSAVDQVERTLGQRGQILAQGGTPPPLMAGSAPVYGSDGNRTAMEAMHQAGHHIVAMNLQAGAAILSVTPAAPVVMAGIVGVPLIQGDWQTAAQIGLLGLLMMGMGAAVGMARAPCAPAAPAGVGAVGAGSGGSGTVRVTQFYNPKKGTFGPGAAEALDACFISLSPVPFGAGMGEADATFFRTA